MKIVVIFITNLVLTFGNLAGIIDLTWDFNNETIYWPGIQEFNYTKMVAATSERGYWYAMNEFCAGEHGGTHFDAPYHFNKDGWKVGEVPLNRLIAKGALIDLSDGNNTDLLRPQHLEKWEQVNGAFENNTALLIRFGFSQYWPNRTKYFAIDPEGKSNFPGLSKDAAQWIVDSGKIVGVGVDTPSVDPGSSAEFLAHRILSKGQIYGMENVKLLAKLPARGFDLVVLPMKLTEGTGAPLRIIALPNK